MKPHAMSLLLTIFLLSVGFSESLVSIAKPKPSSFSTSSASTSPVSIDDTSLLTEPLCLDTIERMKRIQVPVSESIHPSGQVGISFVHWPSSSSSSSSTPPIIMVHGFDSSCLEYRRLGSRLAERGVNTFAVDLLGWGFTQLDGVKTFSAQAKVEALNSFISTVVGEASPFLIAGASLGGAAAIEVAASNPYCKGLVLLDAQGFVDGIGPMAAMPRPIAKLGVEVLKSVPLRSSANQMSYFDKATYATDEAVVVGRLHCLREGWSDALVSFMQSGGFSPSAKVPTINIPSLVLWGRQDGILDGEEFANKFVETLPDASLQWVDECGHVPHLEQPDKTADAIASFLKDRVVSTTIALETPRQIPNPIQAIGLAGVAALAAFAADFLPVH